MTNDKFLGNIGQKGRKVRRDRRERDCKEGMGEVYEHRLGHFLLILHVILKVFDWFDNF